MYSCLLYFSTLIKRTSSYSHRGLEYIPSSISDLSKLVFLFKSPPSLPAHISGRQFSRAVSAPAAFASTPRAFDRAKTATAGLAFGRSKKERPGIQLYLAGNRISKLPGELFELRNLTVLSLRSNNLTHLPSSIHLLASLRELNLANNKLTYLPADILSLSLTSLAVHPNPFIPAPAPKSSTPLHHRLLSPLNTLLPRVLPLSELAFRSLLSSYPTASIAPLDDDSPPLPPHIHDVLAASLPALFTPKTSRDHEHSTNDASLNAQHSACPAPMHVHAGRQMFVRHAEERYEWRSEIAGVCVSGLVPVLWRGCSGGCLAFLEDSVEDGGDGFFDGDDSFELNP
ncbi:hypothetical protein BOTBODRAFT_484309 [Botryobasidium botryosum FD-172 SS1]|uniref:Uncharacterized protein n=1 Tax=Botryobasidium botryosum (strain FD-172 SS1) TaxID=930990 RepID=A0A067N5Q2_BOTB1|nr:hypothetical protein BOTBODRAFT_484309 [Botryobasidium botryosum FD-172 SS1]